MASNEKTTSLKQDLEIKTVKLAKLERDIMQKETVCGNVCGGIGIKRSTICFQA